MARTPIVLRGRRLLRRHLDETSQSIQRFSERFALDRITIQRLLKGQRTRVSVTLAWKIERATKGKVPWHSWLLEQNGEAA